MKLARGELKVPASFINSVNVKLKFGVQLFTNTER